MTDPSEDAVGNADERMRQLANRHIAAGDYVGVFEAVYTAAAEGKGEVPWAEVRDRHQWLRRWAAERKLDGTGKKALVVGCGYGHDAEFVATLGYDTTAFDVSPTAIARARDKHPGSPVHYLTADLFEPPTEWAQAFDLVVEICTVQALPRRMRPHVTEAIGGFVAQGGTLIVISAVQSEPFTDADHGPWPLTRAEIGAFASEGGLTTVEVHQGPDAVDPSVLRWRAEFTR